MEGYRRVPSSKGFADSEVESYERRGDSLTVSLKMWDESIVTLVFNNVIGLLDYAAWQIADVRSTTNDVHGLLQRCLDNHFETVPTDHGYAAFEFVDNDDHVVLTVVAISAEERQ